MALDPLRFAIEIQDNASKALEGVKALLDKLRDTTINIQGGGDLKAIAASLEKIGGVSSGMSNNVEKATAALKREEEALLKLKDAATAAYWETDRLERARNVASSDVNREREKLEVLRNSGDAAKRAADGFKEYSEYAKKAGEELSKIKTYSLNPIKSIEDSTKKSFAELRDYYRRMLYSFANSAGSSFLGDKDLLANAKANIAKYREELIRLRDESKNLFASSGDKNVATMTRSLERMISEYDKVIGKYDEMRAKAQEGAKYYGLDGQIKRQQESLQKKLQEETVANDQLTQQRQRQSQINQQIAQQEQKVAEAKERLAQATQKQQQGDQQTAQALQKEGQSATETAGSLSKLLAEKKAVTDAENKLAQANARNIQSFTAEGGASQTAARQISQLVALLNQISQITPPDLGKLAQSLSGISGVKINDASFIAMGNALGEAAAKIEAAKQSINGGRFGELANRIKEATASLILFTAAFEKFNMTVGKDQGLKDFMTGLGEVIRNVRVQLNSLEKASGGSTVMTDLRKSAERAKYEYYQLENLIKRANAAVNEGKQYGNTSAIERQIAAVKEYIGTLEQLKKVGFANGMTTSDFKLQGQYRIDVDTLKKMVAELERSNAENQKLKTTTSAAAQSVGQLTAEEQRLAQALNQTTEHARGQSQVLSDLKSMAMQYLGVWGGQQFLHNIIEIGGQLEMQRLSIGAILQNQGQANDLFEKIKGLAMQSPFGVVELDQMTKQLTAYGFKYNELFDMTKRLADISAATGTGVDRLALALGHVRSEAALSGYTLRQFSMANVPLLQKLSEKLGKTTQEIRKMVRSKEISYEDVEGIIKDLTNDGGMFYNMQETISQSVKARFKNVKDAMDIMYGEMAESGIGGLLKDIALLLMELTKNWKTVGAAVAGAVAPMVLYKAAMWATSKAVSANVAYTGQFTAKQLEAQAITGNLSKKMLLQAVAARRVSVADAEAAAATLGLTRAQLQWVARSGNVAAATNKATLATSKFTVAQLRSLAVARDGSYSFMARNLARLKFGFGVAGSAAKAFGATLAGLARSFLPLAAISAVFAMISRSVEASSKAQETAKDIAENARDTQKSINAVIQEQADDKLLKAIEKSKFSVNGRYVVQNAIEFNDAELNKANLTERIKSLREELQNLSPLYSGDIIDINEAETQVEQYKILVEKLESLRHVNDVNEATSNVLPNANKRVQGGNWFTRMFGDSFTTDLTDYSNRMEDSVEEINQISEVELDKIDKILNGKLSKIQGDLNLSSLGEALKLYFLNGKRELENGSTDFNAELYKVINSNGDKQTLKDYYDSFFDPVTFGRSLHSQRSQVLGETKKMSQAITSTISTYFKDDPDGAVYALKGFFDRMFSEAGVTDNSVMQETINRILDDMREMSDKSVQAVADEFQRKQVMIQFSNLINPGEIEGAKTEKELDALFQKYLGKIQEWAKIFGIDLEKLGLGSGGKFFGGFRKAFNAAKNPEAMLKDWQKRAGKVFELNTEIKVKSKTITDMDEFAQAVQKDLKEKQEYITRNASHIRHTLTINAGIKFNMDKLDTKALNDMIIQLGTKVQVLLQQGKTEAAKSLNSVIQDELIPFRDVLASIDENKKWLKSEGYPEKDPTKDKSKNKKTGGTKTYKDEVAAEWRERIKLLKDANSLYKEWNKRSGEDAALSRVRQQYGDIFEKWRTDKNLPWKDFKAEDIIEYRSYIQKIVDEAQTRYNSQRNDKAKNYGKEAEAVLREGKKLLDDIDKYDFDEKAREFKTSFEKALDDITRRWEIFNSVRDATGDKMLAFDMAGISQGSRDLRNAADALKRNLADEMQRVGGGELIAKIPFSIDIDEEKLRDQFKAALGDSEKYATTIDGLVEAYKKWQKLQQDVAKSDIDVFSKLIGSVVSYSAQIRKINDELAKQKISIAESGASQSQQQQAVQLAESQADWKKMKLSADYSNLYNKTIAMSRTEFENAADAVQKMIDKLRDLGAMSPDEYLQEVDKLNKARMEWSTSGFLGERGAFGNFISGGNDGLMNYYAQRRDKALQNAEKTTDSEEKKKYNQEAEHYGKLFKRLSELSDAAKDVMTAFQTLQQGIDLLGGLFDSLGMEGAANAMSDAGGILGGALQGASSLSALGPYGMAAGAAIGLIGGIAQVHDKALERHINKLREDVRGIEANTELIVRSRERTLGYDMGDVRRQMAQQYVQTQPSGRDGIAALIKSLGSAQQNKSMYDYYMQNSQGTGYEQEYANLVEQREKYMEILKDQQDKKKKSNEEIEETKSKIAELDDQIMHFSQDLAKELWGIDIKGWADQLSDALASAFENGENMAKAYRETVTNILQQMMQKMMQMQILEPMFANLQKDLFGENGKGGVFDPNNPKGSLSKVTKIIGDYFGKGGEGEKAITASMEFMTAFQRGMQNAGLTVLNEASNTLSSGIQGTSEETSDLLAGYVNALRQDVSVNRILLTQYVTQLWPQYIEAYTAQVTSVSNIDNNVRVIMEMMQLGNGAMYEQIAAMRTRIDNIVLGIDRVSVR